jgi:hypothetical protein
MSRMVDVRIYTTLEEAREAGRGHPPASHAPATHMAIRPRLGGSRIIRTVRRSALVLSMSFLGSQAGVVAKCLWSEH